MRVCANDEESCHLKDAHCADKKTRSLSLEAVLDLLDLLEHPAGSFVKEDGEVVTHGKP